MASRISALLIFLLLLARRPLRSKKHLVQLTLTLRMGSVDLGLTFLLSLQRRDRIVEPVAGSRRALRGLLLKLCLSFAR